MFLLVYFFKLMIAITVGHYSCEDEDLDGMVSSSRSVFQELMKQQSNLDVFF